MKTVLSFKPSDMRMIAELSEETYSLVEKNDFRLLLKEMSPGFAKKNSIAERLSEKLKDIGILHCRFLSKHRAIEILIPLELDDKDGCYRSYVLSVVETHCRSCFDKAKFNSSDIQASKAVVAEEEAEFTKFFGAVDLDIPSPDRGISTWRI